MKKNISKIENDFRKYLCTRNIFSVRDTTLYSLWSIFCAKTNRPFVIADFKRMHVGKHKKDMFARLQKRWDEQIQKSLDAQTQGKNYKVSVQKQLDIVSHLLPSSGYSMGEMKYAYCTHTDNEGKCDNTYKYTGKFRGHETYGSVRVTLKPSELNGYRNIDGVWTKILRRQKNGIHKCETISFQWKTSRRYNNGKVEKVHEVGYLAEYRFKYDGVKAYYHAKNKQSAQARLTSWKKEDAEGIRRYKMYEKERDERIKALSSWRKSNKKFISDLLKRKYTFDDSLKSGNCEIGTLSFCHRHHFQRDVVLTGKQLIRFAKLDEDLAKHIKRIIVNNSGLDTYTTDYDNLQILINAMVDKVKL